MRTIPLLLLPACMFAASVDTDYEPAPQQPTVPVQEPGPPMLGVEMSPVPGRILEREGLSADQGVLVRDVFAGSGAAEMGVQPGDVIISVSGQAISSMTDLRNEVGSHQPGDGVRVEVSRNGQRLNLDGSLREWPSSIPWEPIDSAAERRYRELQNRRQERQTQEVAELAKAASAVTAASSTPTRERAKSDPRSVLPQAGSDPVLAAALGKPAAEALTSMRSWAIDWRTSVDGARVPAAATPLTLPSTPSEQPAWTVNWTLSL